MPRLSRFLFGDWLDCAKLQVDAGNRSVTAAYRDAWGAGHCRQVTLGVNRLVVTDTIDGSFSSAILRWRFASPLSRVLCHAQDCHDSAVRIQVSSTASVLRARCIEGWQSSYYGQKSPIAVFELEVGTAATLTSVITWQA
jgi:hypothetical protein